MDERDPYTPPGAQVELPPAGPDEGGVLPLPWEDKGRYPGLMERILGTLKILFSSPVDAGRALGSHRDIVPGITFLAIVGLPLAWAVQILTSLVFARTFPPPGTENLPAGLREFLRVFPLIMAVATPLAVAFGIALMGLMTHLGLLITGALSRKKGLAVTFRVLLYLQAPIQLINALFGLINGVVPLPPIQILVGVSSVLVGLGIFIYSGVLLARAHATDTWRGILGVFMPFLLFCVCGCFLAILIPFLLHARP